ncbi:MAG: HzsA-related protein, partial [Thermoguttaceae bacterium]
AGDVPAGPVPVALRLRTRPAPGATETAVRWQDLRVQTGVRAWEVPITAQAGDPDRFPPPLMPTLHEPIQQAMIEWDWRMQDGIGTPRASSTWQAATEKTLQRGEMLIRDLQSGGVRLDEKAARWERLRQRFKELSQGPVADEGQWEQLWHEVHWLRRQIALANPLAQVGPLLFVKQVPSIFSHQLTQYQGNCARPGGGLFVLDEPGRSMQCRPLAPDGLPLGSYQFPEVSYDGRRVLFAYCRVQQVPPDREKHLDHVFHLYEIGADGSGLRQLTRGPFDDFAPRYLPDGRIVFVSSRRGGFHRCGRGPCPVHTLALVDPDGSDPHPISFHETHEWDPSVLGDGRLLYTRWDYVDRNAVFYQQLWTVRPDGTDVRIFYGNNTFNPVGIWEARAVPGSHRVMATAGAHHAMTAGSIILVDTRRGVDGPAAITRLTPDALFPESEVPVVSRGAATWFNPAGVSRPPAVPPEAQRWPGHCYRTPYPLSETYFLAAYSFDRLIGEPDPNPPNMFGIYLVDAFGNKELLYRDLNISSLWPVPLRARPVPPKLPSLPQPEGPKEGTFFLQDVYHSWPPLEPGIVKRLRIVQVLPKSTWHANDPPVGLPNISPGRQVLGTVPVEADGSAWFRAPAGIPLAFQALDASGQAVQVMRSVTYLQPGENASCVGCHEPRTTAPAQQRFAQALARGPSTIQPGPDGSKPFSYPILVQPVLDKHCVSCHNPQRPDGGLILTGQAQGHYTCSYHALAPRVPYSDWAGKPGDFRQVNCEPISLPGFFGARGSSLMRLLRAGHQNGALGPEDFERLATWMDTNALFYGTFDREDQARQQRGERIAGPKLQ